MSISNFPFICFGDVSFTHQKHMFIGTAGPTLENHCTRTAQSSLGGCSRRVHKIEYLAVYKG